MTDRPLPGLGELTLAQARGCVDQEFMLPVDSGEDIVFRLISAEPALRDPTAGQNESGRPFSLLFAGPLDPSFEQGLRDLQHPALPLPGLFLVPVSEDGERRIYEAVFS